MESPILSLMKKSFSAFRVPAIRYREFSGGDVVRFAADAPADTGENRNEALFEDALEELGSDTLHHTGTLVVDSVDHADPPRLHPVANDSVGAVRAEGAS